MKASVVTAVLVALLAAAPAQAQIPAPLDHAGRWITASDGRVTVLRGFNMVYKRPPYAPDATGFGDDDASFLAAEGFNTVRLGVIYAAVEPQPGVYDDAYLDRIEQTVETLGRHGIVTMLDFHQDLYNERFQGEGWPDWAVIDDGLPAAPQTGFPTNYLVMPALQRAFDHFWANDPGPGGVGLQDRYAGAWRHVAQRFRDNPHVFAYDLLNEPWPGTAWQECANPVGCPAADARLSDFNDRMFAAIRSVDPTTLVFYEPYVLFNFGADTLLRDTGDEHAGFSFHDYCLTAEQTPGDQGCNTFDEMVFENADQRSAATGDALLLTEFGATDNPAVLLPVLDFADDHMMSWQEWHYCPCADPTTTGPGAKQAVVLDPAKPPVGDNVKASTLGLLTRPYPRLVAGTPTDWSFDPASRRFAAEWSLRRASGQGSFGADDVTELAVPPRTYGDGYAAQVQGGTVRSAPGAPVLRVSACTGVDRVSVTVVPSGVGSSTCAAPAGGGGGAVPRLRLALSPRAVRAGRRARVVARVTTAGRPVRGAAVSLAGRRVRTSRSGRAVLRLRFSRAGRRVVVARATGYRPARAVLRVRPAAGARRPAFTG